MTSLTLTTKQYELRWMGEFPRFNYTSSNLGGLFSDEQSINEYLENKVSEGWVVLETYVIEHK
jgi:hypothetical protein